MRASVGRDSFAGSWLGHDMFGDEVIDVIEVARLSHRVVMVAIRQLFPDDSLRPAQSE